MKKINNAEHIFFNLLRAGLWEEDACLSSCDGIDYSAIYSLAEEQSVIGLIAAGLDHVKDVKVPQELLLSFIGSTLQIEQRNNAMNSFVADLIEKLRRENIYALLVKGQGVAQCYERPLWRASGDVDLLLSEDNYRRAKQILIPIATTVEDESETSKHLGLTINNWLVELHGKLHSSLSNRIRNGLNEIMNETFYGGNVRSWMNGKVQVFLLGVNNDVIYVFTHFLGHFYKGGIGLRQICDWCRMLWANKDKIDTQVLERKIKHMGLMNEWKAFGAFAVEYLGMPVESMPLYSNKKKWKRKADYICSFVLEVGNFGHNRDMSYYTKYPYLLRKFFSLGIRLKDLFRHARIFPFDTLSYIPMIMWSGLRSAVRGE